MSRAARLKGHCRGWTSMFSVVSMRGWNYRPFFLFSEHHMIILFVLCSHSWLGGDGGAPKKTLASPSPVWQTEGSEEGK